GGGGVERILRNPSGDSGGRGMGRKCESGRGLSVGGVYVAQEEAGVGVVENVVNLPAELQRLRIAKMELFEDGEIEIDDAGPRQNVASGVSASVGAQGNLY